MAMGTLAASVACSRHVKPLILILLDPWQAGEPHGGVYVRLAGLPKLRFHDLRHHAITELAESQASESTIMAIAGHVSPKMLHHYSHVRIHAKRTALDALATRRGDKPIVAGGQAGYDTRNDTNVKRAEDAIPQVIETMVELVGIEPTTSSLRTMRSPS